MRRIGTVLNLTDTVLLHCEKMIRPTSTKRCLHTLTTKFQKIPAKNQLFSSSEIFKLGGDSQSYCPLRLTSTCGHQAETDLTSSNSDFSTNMNASKHFILQKQCLGHRTRFRGSFPQSVLSSKGILSYFEGNKHLNYVDYKPYSMFTGCVRGKSIDKICFPGHLLKPLSRGLNISAQSVVNSTPPMLQPYLRLIRADKPIGTWLLFWPCTWSICLAGQGGQLPDFYLIALFGVGAFLMRGAGCIINDMWDKDYDRKVERTRLRPLASGELSSFQALCCLGVNLSLSLAVLLQLNWYSVMLGTCSMLLVVTYPLMKRYTYWPQAFLGLTLNWGVLLGWSELHGTLEWPVIPLYLATVLYTMTYDSIYSHQDKYDDMLIGVKSTALKFGDQTKQWLCGFGGIMTSGLLCTGVLCDQTWPYYLSVLITTAHLTYQIYDVDLDNADDCAAKFRSNSWLGLILCLGAGFGTVLKKPREATAVTPTSEEETSK